MNGDIMTLKKLRAKTTLRSDVVLFLSLTMDDPEDELVIVTCEGVGFYELDSCEGGVQ